ncbi:MAG: metal-dependent hydrolase [Actinomycetota bacterium]|nr:metal-dependent hydrolase [Actinomycetota bacterium]
MRLPAAALAALVVAVVVVEGILRLEPPTLFLGAADWIGHLATTAILVAAIPPPLPRTLIIGAFAALLIDLDHIPDLLADEGINAETPRPVTHSLLTVLAIGAIAAAVRARLPRYGDFALGVAIGVPMHLVRDVFVGPGVALLAPLYGGVVEGPFLLYLAGLIFVALYAALRPRPVQRRG